MAIGNALIETLKAMAELHGRNLSPAAATMLASDLAEYPEAQVINALRKCRKEIPRFPTTAEILARIDDGHPGVEEAWAMCPKYESDSVVWTEEISKAFFAALPLLDEDQVAARQAFKEVYTRELQRARDERRAPRWSASLGHDKNHQESVLKDAVSRGRLLAPEAAKLLPHVTATPPLPPGGLTKLIPQLPKAETEGS